MTAAAKTGPALASRAVVDYPLDALVSYHYYKGEKDMAPLVATRRLRLIGDSGAFSAYTQGTPIKLDEYAAWLKQWQPYLCWAAALDVIGDPAATLANWRRLRDHHQLATVPTLHAGTDPKWLDAYVADGVDFFGLGGLVGRALDALPWVVKVFRYVRDKHPQVRFHIWGVTNRKYLDNLPAYSADSSGILGAAYRFAVLRLFDPRTGKHTNAQLRGNSVFKLGPLLRQVYGVNPADIAKSTPENRHLLIQICAHSTQLYAAWLQRRHKVTAPSWGLRTPAHLDATPAGGPRVHGVSTHGPDYLDAVGGTRTRTHVTSDRKDLLIAAGTRIHTVDGSVGNLLAAAGTRKSEEPTS